MDTKTVRKFWRYFLLSNIIFLMAHSHVHSQQGLQIGFTIEKSCFNEVILTNESIPMNDTVHFLWQIKNTEPQNTLIHETPEIHPTIILKPGDYIITLNMWSDHSAILTDSCEISIKSDPIITIEASDIIICSNNSLSTFQIDPENIVSFNWSVDPDHFITKIAGEDEYLCSIEWSEVEQLKDIHIHVNAIDGNGCSYKSSTNVLLLPQKVPQVQEIIRKPENSDILICITDSLNSMNPDFLYEWGIENKDDEQIINSMITDLSYFDFNSGFDHKLDTAKYKYFVNIRQSLFQLCQNKVFYHPKNKDEKAINSNSNSFKISIYPNPNEGIFNVEVIVDTDGEYLLKVFNQYGNFICQKSSLNLLAGLSSRIPVAISDLKPGLYILGFRNVVTNQIHYEKFIIN